MNDLKFLKRAIKKGMDKERLISWADLSEIVTEALTERDTEKRLRQIKDPA